MLKNWEHSTEHVCPACSRSRSSIQSSVSCSTNRHKILARRRRHHICAPIATVALGVVLAGAAAVSVCADSNPPQFPPSPPSWPRDVKANVNNKIGKQDGWGRWVPPPPGPPPGPIPPPEVGNEPPGSGYGVGGVEGQGPGGLGDASGIEMGSSEAAMGTNGQGSMELGTGPAVGQTNARIGMGYARIEMEYARGVVEGAVGQGQGNGGQTYDRVLMHQEQRQEQQQHELSQQQQNRQLRPQPPPWGASAPHQILTATPADKQGIAMDQSLNGGEGFGHHDVAYRQGRPSHNRPPSAIFQSPVGMMGGAGESDMGPAAPAGDGQWETPSAASAGAITPEVKLNEYRQEAAPADEDRADGTTEQISRALLSNTDKEIIFDGLKKLYRKKILPLEESSRYAHFHSPPMNPADFEAKPMVLIVGQYSVGKTSFIRSLLKRDFPGQRVGPEPTTDRFVAVTHGEDERVMPGHALAMQTDKPFHSLQQFGNNFLTKFEGAVVNAPILRNITLIDTPGVLSGEKQRIGRDYDFASVISWFAERADLIVVMFDAHKLDISDELKMVIDTLRPHHDKTRVLLNKADAIDTQQLMRVYGALMWSLGKVMQTPEVCRVYIGSFWEAPLNNLENKYLLEKEKRDLLEELMLLPENAVVRRINELVKRARSVKVHAYIIHYLRKQMPYMMGKQDKQEKLVRRLDQEFLACARRYGLPLGDFPKVEKFRRSLREIKDISKFNRLDKSLVNEMDKVFSIDIPRLMEKAARPSDR